MLEMINVSYAYKSKKEIVHVLDKVTYRFEIGEMYGIFGPSGSGKTTCLSLLAGLEKPDEGEILLDGENPPPENFSPVQRTGLSAPGVYLPGAGRRRNDAPASAGRRGGPAAGKRNGGRQKPPCTGNVRGTALLSGGSCR